MIHLLYMQSLFTDFMFCFLFSFDLVKCNFIFFRDLFFNFNPFIFSFVILAVILNQVHIYEWNFVFLWKKWWKPLWFHTHSCIISCHSFRFSFTLNFALISFIRAFYTFFTKHIIFQRGFFSLFFMLFCWFINMLLKKQGINIRS